MMTEHGGRIRASRSGVVTQYGELYASQNDTGGVAYARIAASTQAHGTHSVKMEVGASYARFYPSGNNTIDLGTASYRFNNGYINNWTVYNRISPDVADGANIGSSSVHWLGTYTTNIYRDNEYALSCIPGKKNMIIKDALAKIRNIKELVDTSDGKIGKMDPASWPDEMRGPVVEWGNYGEIPTINSDMYLALLLRGIVELDMKLDMIGRS
jgi:hypothetical protein